MKITTFSLGRSPSASAARPGVETVHAAVVFHSGEGRR
jgi:hypothetical protein